MDKKHLEVYKSLNRHRVKYLLVGGMAAVLYGSPRLTKDVDILIEPTLRNAKRLLIALKNIGFGTADLTTPEKIVKNEVTIFDDYIRLDVLTKIKGVTFEEGWKKKRTGKIENISIYILGLAELIKAKKSSGREIDLEDVKILKKIKKLKGLG